ncbi:MAG: hypothetical protein AABW75_00340 [Nanoarchaeota archaeon]
MKGKLLILILVVSVLIVSTFLVAALTYQNNSKNLPQQKSLKIVELNNDVELEDDLKQDKEKDIPIPQNALDRASAFALQYIGEGKVTDTEIDDEEGYYEIEITLDNGSELDVHLDENFKVISTEYG